MTYVLLLISLIAIFMAWQANRKHAHLQRRISELHSRNFQVRREMLEKQEETDRELTKLRFELLKSQGNLQVTAEMTIDEILLIHPLAGQVLGQFHIGGCSSCAVDGSTRLDYALASSGQTAEPVLVALNKLLTDTPSNGNGTPDFLKTPNVELTF